MQISRASTAIKALRQLGFTQVALNALYRFGLASGHYRRVTETPKEYHSNSEQPDFRTLNLLPLPAPQTVRECLGPEGLRALLTEAGEIADGRFRQFGAEPVDIQLTPPGPLAHWTDYETGKARHEADDIKLVWEPARFGWAFVLGRAYHISGEEHFAEAFWRYFEIFILGNPAYIGPNWTSGQEVGLRLMAFVWAGQVFAASKHSTPQRMLALVNAVAVHAGRIPVTLVYARSQNNNHLLTEAAALLTAGLALPGHPDSQSWLKTGRRWLNWCFTSQINAQGEYVQHSANYQRLALQTALWVNVLSLYKALPGEKFPDFTSREKLGRAAGWLAARLDPLCGGVPNLGANDGALIFPLANADISDYRPVAGACARAYLGHQIPPGPWDEMSLWFGLPLNGLPPLESPHMDGMLPAGQAWASLRAVHYTSRPSHADQLHCELWWRGLNIARDPGTYSYNTAPPWDNRLTSTLVHNTVTVNGQEQMTRASRFLYLDWADAHFVNRQERSVTAETTAYTRCGVLHTRRLAVHEDGSWLIRDELVRSGGEGQNIYRLHWLLPDWEWELEGEESRASLRLLSPHGWISLAITADARLARIGLLRAGQLLKGKGLTSAVFGWYSPTYNVKEPALALAVEVQSDRNVTLESKFIFPTS